MDEWLYYQREVVTYDHEQNSYDHESPGHDKRPQPLTNALPKTPINEDEEASECQYETNKGQELAYLNCTDADRQCPSVFFLQELIKIYSRAKIPLQLPLGNL